MLNELAKEIHGNNVEKGFYENPAEIGTRLCLIHSEVSEALEADRKGQSAYLELFHNDLELAKTNTETKEGKDSAFRNIFRYHIKDSIADEMADVIIRALDFCHYEGIDIDEHIRLKMKYNSLRPHKHGKKY